MTRHRTRNRCAIRSAGFTLLEVMIASAVSVLVLAGAMAALVNSMRSWRAAAIRSELHMDLEKSMEMMRQDLRLSSVGIGLMAFHPADASEYTAISFPLSTPGTNGLLRRDAVDQIIWDTTVVYHVRPGSPDELIRSTFSPRNQLATPAERHGQLLQVVSSTSLADVVNAALAGETATSRVIFQNLVNMVFRPPQMSFDGYAPTYEKARTINWGSIVLNNGVHDLTFTVHHKNALSTGYKAGIDRFSLGYSGSIREGEIYLPANTHPASPYYQYAISGGSVIAQDMSTHGASWSGRSQLTYTPNFVLQGPTGSKLTFKVQNDLWCDTNFDNPPGSFAWNCSRKTDTSFTNQAPFISDIVVSMDHGLSWEAENVTDGMASSIMVTNVTTMNVIHGGTNVPSAIRLNGAFVRLAFNAGSSHSLHVRNVQIGRRQAGDQFVAGTTQTLTFNGGQAHVQIPSGDSVWTDWRRFEIDRDESYLVSWERKDAGNAIPPGLTDAIVFTGNATHVLSYLDGVPDNRVVAMTAMEVRAPSNGVYRSGVYDTRILSPVYRNITWTQVEPFPDGDIDIRVRSANNPDMSDAGNWWYPAAYFQNNINNDISPINGGRYVQYEALFTVAGLHTRLPILRDVTITWDAPTGIVDLTVDFARGPDYGIVTADVNGQSFIKGVGVELEIFKEGPYGLESVPGSMEIRPLNTGR
jgi:prepilin-type N-terminal cleavage/methylation domain-containing protein